MSEEALPSGVTVIRLPDGPIDASRVSLRRVEERDLETLAYIANNEKVAKYCSDRFPSPYTLEHAKQHYEKVKASLASDELKEILLLITVDDVVAGGIGMHMSPGEKRHIGELGYWLGEQYWGHGIATIAVGQMLKLAWETIPILMRIEAQIFAPHKASMAVVMKHGFKLESIAVHGGIKRGKFLDNHKFVLFRDPLDPSYF